MSYSFDLVHEQWHFETLEDQVDWPALTNWVRLELIPSRDLEWVSCVMPLFVRASELYPDLTVRLRALADEVQAAYSNEFEEAAKFLLVRTGTARMLGDLAGGEILSIDGLSLHRLRALKALTERKMARTWHEQDMYEITAFGLIMTYYRTFWPKPE